MLFAKLPYCQLRPGFVVSNEVQDERESTIINQVPLGAMFRLASGFMIDFSVPDVLLKSGRRRARFYQWFIEHQYHDAI